MTKYLIALLLPVIAIVIEVSGTHSQTVPTLSKTQMYADFDTLVHNIAEISPQIEVRQSVTGIDIFQQLAYYRSDIENVKNTEQFAILIRKALVTCQDGHTGILWNGYFPNEEGYKKRGISQEAIKLLPVYDSLFLGWSAKKKLNLKLKYVDGRYYNLATFSHQNQKYPAGLRLVTCNNAEINDYVHGLNNSKRMMRWDFKNKRYFSEDFYTSYHLSENDTLRLSFQDARGNTIAGNFRLSDSLTYSKPDPQTIDSTRRVAFFAAQKLLYIKIPVMKDADYYVKEISRQAANADIQKIVIDIRDNPGGSDNVWQVVVSKVIPKSLHYQDLLLCINSPAMRRRYPDYAGSWQKAAVPFLKDARYSVFYAGPVTIEPSSSSLKYDGKVYVIQNENIYSSAGSLAAVAAIDSNIVSVGSPTGRLLGKGIDPLIFELPNSKILYRIEPVIDFMNAGSPADVFHDKVEIPVELTLDEHLDRLQSKAQYTQEYLINTDPVFKKILAQDREVR